MKRLAIGLAAAAAMIGALVAAQQPAESIDTAAIAKIRDEGLNKSQVMETMFWLTDRYGPRLVGSPEFEEAGDWAVKQLTAWGVTNVHKERWPIGKGWSLVNFHATMTSPRVMPIIGVPKAWTPGIAKPITADVVRVQIATEADCVKLRGTLKGKIVLTQPARAVRMLDYGDGTVLRYSDKDDKWLKEALTLPPARGGRGAGAAGGGAAASGRGAAGAPQGRGAGVAPTPAPPVPADPCAAIGAAVTAAGRGRGAAGAATNPDDPATAAPAAGGGRGGGAALQAALMRFYKTEGVVALFDRGSDTDTAAGGSELTWVQQHIDGGTFGVQSGGDRNADPATVMPQVTLAVEHYNRMVRLLEHNVPVKVDLDLQVKYTEERQPGGFNIVGDIPGTDKADEIVLIGAHFDSWQGATGATDNATGSAAMMEVLRIFKTTGLRPRRTVRIGLWGGEEAGLVGSRTYATDHLGTRAQPKPENDRIAGYFNLDNGTGKIRGVWMQQNAAVEPIFRQWIAPLKDLGVDILGPRSVSQTDHTSFDSVGVPAFQFVQERYEYNARTHHTNMDFLDRVQAADLKQTATVAAIFVWQTANRAEKLPRKPAPAGGGQ
jgi:hypothetical protein